MGSCRKARLGFVLCNLETILHLLIKLTIAASSSFAIFYQRSRLSLRSGKENNTNLAVSIPLLASALPISDALQQGWTGKSVMQVSRSAIDMSVVDEAVVFLRHLYVPCPLLTFI